MAKKLNNKKVKKIKKIQKTRELDIDSKISILLNVHDNIIFGNQKDVFEIFNINANPNQKGCYLLKGTNFALWFPNIPSKKNFVENYLNIGGNEIYEKFCSNKSNLSNIKGEQNLITFCKINKEIKFVGVFREFKAGRKNHIFKKISDSVIVC